MTTFRRLLNKKTPAVDLTEDEQIEDALFPLVMLRFNGNVLPFRLRELTQSQILACGEFSLIETLEDKILNGKVRGLKRTISVREMETYAERCHNICRFSLVKPSYDQIMVIAGKYLNFNDIQKELDEIQKSFGQMDDVKQRKELQDKHDFIGLMLKFILPVDFMTDIIDFALGISKSKVKEVTGEMLINAAILAERGHDNPIDHVHDFLFKGNMWEDFNARAWLELEKSRKKIRELAKV